MMINICNKILVQTLNIILRLDTCFKIRKQIHRKMTVFNQDDYTIHVYNKGIRWFILDFKIYCKQPTFHIGIGSQHWQK